MKILPSSNDSWFICVIQDFAKQHGFNLRESTTKKIFQETGRNGDNKFALDF